MGILWTIIIGFIAGVIARFILARSQRVLRLYSETILGIAGLS